MAISPAVPSLDRKAPVLNSWKEIATYLGRGVRTVQRYERELQLPVRRVGGKAHSSVVALSQDLDTWLEHATLQKRDELLPRAANRVSVTAESVADFHELRLRCAQLRAEHTNALGTLIQSLSNIMREIKIDCGIRRAECLFCENREENFSGRKAS